jgi:RNA-binding protein
MTIDKKLKSELRTKANKLSPIVFIGNNGYTDNVKMEINRGLEDHELIKVRIQADRDVRKQLFEEICETTDAEPIQLIGGIGVIYRKNQE